MAEKLNAQQQLQKDIAERLLKVIDPETGVDVIRMRLVQDISVDEDGHASYIFRPSSPLCPIAVNLAISVVEAVAEVEGISGQSVEVVDYIETEKLNVILELFLADRYRHHNHNHDH